MKRLTLASVVLAVAGIGATVVTTPAQAQTGQRCGFSSEFDPTQEGDTQTGEIHGGPIVNDVFPGGNITLTCTIQVGGLGATHGGPDAIPPGPQSASGPGVAVLEPRQISYVGPFGQPVYLCSQVTFDDDGDPFTSEKTLYYDADDAANPTDFVGWSTSSSADCGLALYQDGGFSGRCSITGDNGLRLLCRMDNGQLCLIWLDGTCLVPLPL